MKSVELDKDDKVIAEYTYAFDKDSDGTAKYSIIAVEVVAE